MFEKEAAWIKKSPEVKETPKLHPDFKSNKTQTRNYISRIGSEAEWQMYTPEGELLRFCIECKDAYVQVFYTGKKGRFAVPVGFNQDYESFSKEFNYNIQSFHRMREKDCQFYREKTKMNVVKSKDQWDMWEI